VEIYTTGMISMDLSFKSYNNLKINISFSVVRITQGLTAPPNKPQELHSKKFSNKISLFSLKKKPASKMLALLDKLKWV